MCAKEQRLKGCQAIFMPRKRIVLPKERLMYHINRGSRRLACVEEVLRNVSRFASWLDRCTRQPAVERISKPAQMRPKLEVIHG